MGERSSGEAFPSLAESAAAPAPSDLAGLPAGFGATGSDYSAVPNMIGDLLGGGGFLRIGTSAFISIPTAGGGGALARFQISENNSPLPQNRIYFNYSHFHNAQLFGNRFVDLNRYTPGFEKTFYGGLMSFQVAAPFTSGLSSSIDLYNEDINASRNIPQDAELGDVALALKAILWQAHTFTFTSGLAVTLPTGDDLEFAQTFADPGFFSFNSVKVENESVHLKPFVGMLSVPNPRWFFQSFVQFDFDTNGNPVVSVDQFDSSFFSDEEVLSGRFQDQNLLTFDLSVGRWLHRNFAARHLTGVAGIVELHYTTSLNDSDRVEVAGDSALLNPLNRFDILNLTSGLHFQIGMLSSLRVAAAVPLREESPVVDNDVPLSVKRPFDTEVVVQFNRFF